LKKAHPSNEFDGEARVAWPTPLAMSTIEMSDAAKQAKQEQGLVVVHRAFTNAALVAANVAAKEAWMSDVAPQVTSSTDVINANATGLMAITRKDTCWPTTVIGNKNFGYLIAGPEAKEERHKATLPSSGVEIVFAIGGAFRANLALLCHADSAVVLDFLFRLSGHEHTSIISQDYCKLHRGVLTVPHVDIYDRSEQSINRMQAIAFGACEGRVRLCYLRFSHRPEVRKIIVNMLAGGKDIWATGRGGFRALPKESAWRVINVFLRAGCVQYGAPRDLVAWEPGVIHFEALVNEAASGGDDHGPPRITLENDTSTSTERYVVGTHVPSGFTQRELLEIGVIADAGFVFHSYDNANAGNAADVNSVHKKSTQWKTHRAVPDSEKARAAALVALTPSDYDARAAEWSAARRRCFMGQPPQQQRKRANDDDDDGDDAAAEGVEEPAAKKEKK
jgi:hypothetical protein